MQKSSWGVAQLRGIGNSQSFSVWKEAAHFPINDPMLPIIVEQSVKKALLERGESREAISLLKEIKEQLQVIASEIKELKPLKEEFVIFRDISRDDAKKEITKYFTLHKDDAVGYSDLVRDLHLDLRLVVELCSELESEGRIV